jgi:hypothetical protein
MLPVTVSTAVLRVASVAVTVKENEPEFSGVPEMAPEAAVKPRPTGKVPEETV